MKSKPVVHDCEFCGHATSSDFLDYAAFEELLKDLDAAARTAKFAAHAQRQLDDKLPLHRAQKAIEQARSILRPHLYAFEDAARIAFTVA